MIYIIDTYNKYAHNADVVHTFLINDQPYCIRKVPLEWGEPDFPEKQCEEGAFALYETLEDALQYITQLRGMR